MDLEMIKTILVEIIREAQNLPSNELERINGTDVAVKRGRAEEFKAYARLYVEVANNIKINDSVDYITIAFNDLQKEIKEEENNFYIEKAEGYYNSNYGNVEKFNQSNTVLSTLTKNHNSLQERFSVLQKNMRNATVTQTQLKQFDSISSDIRDFLNGMRHVKDTIIDLKRQINDNFTAAATTQLETLRNNYQNTANSVPAAYSSDGKSILKSDKLEYDNILRLLEIIKRVNENEHMVVVNGTLCVNLSMVDEVKELLATSKLFSKIARPEYSPISLNSNLLKNLQSRIANFEQAGERLSHNAEDLKKLAVDNLTTYEALIELERILKEANDSYIPKDKRTQFNRSYSENYVGVWDAAFVHETLKERVDALLRKTGIVRDKDPNVSKHAENEKLILALENHKRALEDITPLGQGNILTSIANDGVTVVRDEFLEEYNAVIGALDILRATEGQNDLREVWGIASVHSDAVLDFKKYISKISILSKKVPGLSANDLLIDDINKQLTDLNNRARTRKKEDPSAILATNGVVLHEDLALYNALIEKLKFLELSKGKANLLEVDGAFIAPKYLSSYNDALAKEHEAKTSHVGLGSGKPVGSASGSGSGSAGAGSSGSSGSGSGTGSSSGTDVPPVMFDNNNLNTETKEFVQKNVKYLLELADGVPSNLISHLGGLAVNEGVMQALLELKTCLDNADKADAKDLIEINGTKILKDDEEKFNAAMSVCEKADIFTYNSIRIDEIEVQLGLLASSAIGVPEGTKNHEAIVIDGKKVLNINKDKYATLLEISNLLFKYLNVSTEEDEKDFVKIGGLYIHKDDEDKYKHLVEHLNRIEASLTANDKFLAEIIEKINNLVSDAASSLDTNVVTIDGFTVLKSSENELQSLLDVKECLERAMGVDEAELKTIDGIKIRIADEALYTKAMAVLNNTELLSVEANNKKLKDIENLIDDLQQNAVGLDIVKLTTIDGYTVASKDEEKLRILLDMKEILTKAIDLPDSECKLVDGFKIRKVDEQKYIDTLGKLNELMVSKNKNEEKEAEINAKIAELEAKAVNAPDEETVSVEGHKVLKTDEAEMDRLLDIKDCLERAKTSNNLVKQKDGIMVDKADAKLYKEVNKPKRQKVSIRKLGAKGLAALKAHKKAVIAIGLTASLLVWGVAAFAPGVLISIPAAIQGITLGNVGAVLNGAAISGASIFGTLAATKGRNKTRDFTSNLLDSARGRQAISETELAINKIAHDSMQEYTGTVSEEELDKLENLSVSEQIEQQMARLDNIHKSIDDRIKAVNSVSAEEREKEREKDDRVLTPHTIVSEEPVQVVTIPSDEEIIASISDKNLVMAQVDQYFDKVLNGEDGLIYRTPIYKLTGIDLFRYKEADPAKVVKAKRDVDEALNKWDVSYILGQANNYFYADKKGLETDEYRDIVQAATDINLDEFKTSKKNQEILREDIRVAMKRKHDYLMAQLVFAQAENYKTAKKYNEGTSSMRDAVFGVTGVDLDQYDIEIPSVFHEADKEVIKALKSNNEDLVVNLQRKVEDLQTLIDAGTASPEEIAKAEADKEILLNRIESLSKNGERGI